MASSLEDGLSQSIPGSKALLGYGSFLKMAIVLSTTGTLCVSHPRAFTSDSRVTLVQEITTQISTSLVFVDRAMA